jgi:nicotinate-nucleotide adenylyltransferase
MKIALFGGSFNPPHVCHVLAATWVLSTRDVEQVWFLPTFKHAFGKDLAPFEARCEMTARAIAPLGARALVSRVESELGAVSRTIDTLEHLMGRHPEHTFSLVVGSDILLETSQWKEFDRLVTLAELHVVGRAGVPGQSGASDEERFGIFLPDISSTAVRERLRAGDVAWVRRLVPRAVVDYIEEQGLYGLRELSE